MSITVWVLFCTQKIKQDRIWKTLLFDFSNIIRIRICIEWLNYHLFYETFSNLCISRYFFTTQSTTSYRLNSSALNLYILTTWNSILILFASQVLHIFHFLCSFVHYLIEMKSFGKIFSFSLQSLSETRI